MCNEHEDFFSHLDEFPEVRAEQARRRVEAKEKTAQNNMDVFAVEHADVFAFLKKNADFGFYASLLDGVAKYGSLTNAQMAAVQRGMDKQAAREKARTTPAARVADADLTTTLDVFKTAKASGLKRLKLRIKRLVITMAGDNSRNRGCLHVKKDNGLYLGKVTPTGEFFKSRDCYDGDFEMIKETLSGDILKAAQLHGQETGSCSCCGRELTNPESIELGIGPICRDKWGL